MKNWITGLLAGSLATAPMSAVMVWMHHRLPRHERYPLPPAQITARIAAQAAEKAEMAEHLDSTRLRAATVLAHFGFGATTGVFYAEVRKYLPGPPAVQGMLFGLGVWTSFYLGLLPAAGILSPATEHPARRNALMIVAHLIWGAVLGIAVERWENEN